MQPIVVEQDQALDITFATFNLDQVGVLLPVLHIARKNIDQKARNEKQNLTVLNLFPSTSLLWVLITVGIKLRCLVKGNIRIKYLIYMKTFMPFQSSQQFLSVSRHMINYDKFCKF